MHENTHYRAGHPPQPQFLFTLPTRLAKKHLGLPSFPHKRPFRWTLGHPILDLPSVQSLCRRRVIEATSPPPKILPNDDPTIHYTPGFPQLRNLPRSLGDCRIWYSGRIRSHYSGSTERLVLLHIQRCCHLL